MNLDNNGNLSILRSMIGGVRSEWFSAYRLAKRAFAVRYKRSRFGLLWEFLDPLAIAAIFATMYHFRGISVMDTGMPYTVFIVTGIMLWYTFQDGIDAGMKAFTSQKQLLSAVRLKPELLVISNLYLVMFSTFFRVAIALVTTLIFLPLSITGVLAYVIAALMMIALGLGVGFFLAPFVTVNSDFGSITRMIVRPLMFISSVIFPLPIMANAFFEWLRILNPMALIIENARGILVNGVFVDTPLNIAFLFLLCACFSIIGWYTIHVTLPLVGDQN